MLFILISRLDPELKKAALEAAFFNSGFWKIFPK